MNVNVNVRHDLKDMNEPEEIISHLNQAALKQLIAVIWQRKNNEIIFNARVNLVSVFQEELKIKFIKDFVSPIDSEEEIFFAMENGLLIFKTSMINVSKKNASLTLPSMAKGVERRRSPRIKFKYEDKIDLVFMVQSTATRLECVGYLLDKNEHGMCISISSETVKHLSLNKQIKILRGNLEVQKSTSIIRSIRVLRKATMGRSEVYAVGLEFI